jgi:pimeloyl-ACP methyl ester carboxylesterase
MSPARTISVHGHPLAYAEAGSGPVLLLVHGIARDRETWREVIEPLAAHHTVIAPDLPGHGLSAPAGGDYSVGGLAAVLRDLLLTLGHQRATLIGHSLGGGVAMQFAYLFPEMTERLALVSSGGLGPEVSPVLRAAALPGAAPFIATTAPLAAALLRLLDRFGPGLRAPGTDFEEIARGYASLADPGRRAAFLATLRTAIGLRGQRVSATARLYLAAALPVLIVWGAEDRLIPPRHGAEGGAARQQARPSPGRRPPPSAPGAGALPRRARALPRGNRAGPARPRGLGSAAGCRSLAGGGVQVLDVEQILTSSRRQLHRSKVRRRADRDSDSQHLRLAGPRAQLRVARYSLQPLYDVKAAQLRLDRHLLAACQCRGDRDGAAEQGLARLYMSIRGNRRLSHQFQVLGIRRDDDVDILRGAHDPASPERESTDHDELSFGLHQAPQNLIEGGRAHRRFAASAILISSWLRAIVSARLTLSGRRASSRRRRTRTASLASAGERGGFSRVVTSQRVASAGSRSAR